MIKVTNLQEMSCITNADLRMYILEKVKTMMQEYQVENLDDIGCFVKKVCFYMVSELLATAMAKTSICLLGW